MTLFNNRLLAACAGQPTDCTPIWLMRQAGRYQPEYRALREKYTMMELCTTPELAAEVTLAPLRRFDLDAAILFSDLTLPFTPMGAPFQLKEGQGPVVETPIRTPADVNRLRCIQPDQDLAFALETIRLLRPALNVPLVGFTGAPFTMAAYLIEGSGVRDCPTTRAFMLAEPGAWHALMEVLVENAARYLEAQVQAGVQAVQLFDSWVGALSPDTYRSYLLPHMQRLFQRLKLCRIPVIHFGTGTATLLEVMREAGGDVISVDWRIPLDDAWRRIGADRAIQGNLDPVALLAPREVLLDQTRLVLKRAAGRPGHIFNLGHGLLPATPIESVQLLVDTVHEESAA
ncbi:MAG: uroporphyrinogen decarboxylase [Armatimonadetes bacterium]|nr:uroporphyrinogen decarboxylase [Armatimonadota bacterium]MDE2206354.1 uroporphyrinogen decarboxylase [Armatimonadota bacterium]